MVLNKRVFLFLILFSNVLLAKYNVCTITINSPDEKEVFQKYLPKEDFNFIELTTFFKKDRYATTDARWLENTCNSKIKCDILLISGHFGGKFFGETDLSLSMEDLENISCNQSCPSLIEYPKEVYLFGCNTLAGKDKDSRTPEEYYDVLIRDRIPPAQAAQIVATRYSPIGSTIKDRMQRIFWGSKVLYGFDSRGPLGSRARPLLERYFSKVPSGAKRLKELEEKLAQLQSKTNSEIQENFNPELTQSFRYSALTHTVGLLPSDPAFKVRGELCNMYDKNKTREDKLETLYRLLNSDLKLAILPTAIEFFSGIKDLNLNRFTEKENQIILQIKNNSDLKDSFVEVLPAIGMTPLMQYSLNNFFSKIGWLSADLAKKKNNEITKNIVRDLSLENISSVCSLELSSRPLLNQGMIQDLDNLSQLEAILIACLLPDNDLQRLVHEKFNTYFRQLLKPLDTMVTEVSESDIESAAQQYRQKLEYVVNSFPQTKYGYTLEQSGLEDLKLFLQSNNIERVINRIKSIIKIYTQPEFLSLIVDYYNRQVDFYKNNPNDDQILVQKKSIESLEKELRYILSINNVVSKYQLKTISEVKPIVPGSTQYLINYHYSQLVQNINNVSEVMLNFYCQNYKNKSFYFKHSDWNSFKIKTHNQFLLLNCLSISNEWVNKEILTYFKSYFAADTHSLNQNARFKTENWIDFAWGNGIFNDLNSNGKIPYLISVIRSGNTQITTSEAQYFLSKLSFFDNNKYSFEEILLLAFNKKAESLVIDISKNIKFSDSTFIDDMKIRHYIFTETFFGTNSRTTLIRDQSAYSASLFKILSHMQLTDSIQIRKISDYIEQIRVTSLSEYHNFGATSKNTKMVSLDSIKQIIVDRTVNSMLRLSLIPILLDRLQHNISAQDQLLIIKSFQITPETFEYLEKYFGKKNINDPEIKNFFNGS